VALLLAKAGPARLTRMFMILASVADYDAVLFSAGLRDESRLRQHHAAYRAYKKMGVDVTQMPAEVVAGERLYQRLAWRATHRNGS
jgi:hypothetical protein